MTLLAPCPRCSRHVRADERACPFCDRPFEAGELRAAAAPDPRMGRAALLAWRITLGGSVAAACATTAPDPSRTVAVPSGAGGTGGTTTDAGAVSETNSAPADAGSADAYGGPWPRMVAIYSDTVVMINEAVYFKPHSASVASNMKSTLEVVAQIMLRDQRFERVEVQGFADQSEGRARKSLAERRARAVRDRLIKLGVPAWRLVAKGYDTEGLSLTYDPEDGRNNDEVLFQALPAASRESGDAGSRP